MICRNSPLAVQAAIRLYRLTAAFPASLSLMRGRWIRRSPRRTTVPKAPAPSPKSASRSGSCGRPCWEWAIQLWQSWAFWVTWVFAQHTHLLVLAILTSGDHLHVSKFHLLQRYPLQTFRGLYIHKPRRALSELRTLD